MLFNVSMSESPANSGADSQLKADIRKDADDLLLGLQESYEHQRLAFIQNAKKVFKNAISREIEQQANIENLPGNKFEHFFLYYFPQEKTAQEGEVYKPTIGVKLAEDVDEHGQLQGDEMQLRIVIPEDLIITANIESSVIDAWLDSVNEVYIICKSDKQFKRQATMCRVLPEGFQIYSPKEDESQIDFDQELQDWVAETPDITGLAKRTLTNTASIYELLVKLGTYKLVSQRSTELTEK